jgi:hypothetical protein
MSANAKLKQLLINTEISPLRFAAVEMTVITTCHLERVQYD